MLKSITIIRVRVDRKEKGVECAEATREAECGRGCSLPLGWV